MRILKNFIVNAFLVGIMMTAVLLCCCTQVQADQAGDFTYTITDGKVQITKYTGEGGVVTIPSTLGGFPVISIGNYAFWACSSLNKISIPQGVTSIGDSAFSCCETLTSICIPQEVTSIGYGAFFDCINLTSIYIPKIVKSIGDDAFGNCIGVTSIAVALDNLNYKSIDGVLYNNTGTILIACPGGLEDISIPQGVTCIGNYAFDGCISLTNIGIPQGVTSIGICAFRSCYRLTSISIPKGVTRISKGTFVSCQSLTNISIPQGVTSIDDYAFEGCSGLTKISIPLGVTSIGDVAFAFCKRLKSMSFPQEVKSIGYYAFEDCSDLTNISIPQAVESIGEGAFGNCTGLTTIRFNSATTIINGNAETIPATTKIIGYTPSTAKTYATKYNRAFETIGYSATPIVQIGVNPNDGDNTGIFVGLKDISDTQGIVVPDAMLASYQIEINYNHDLAKIFDIVDEAQMGQIALNTGVDTIRASVADLVSQGTNNFEKLFFVPLTLTGASTTSTAVTIKFTSLGNQNGNQIGIPDVTLTFQRGKIVNDSSQNSLSTTDAVAGLQYLAKIVDAGTDQGKVNVINMASILPPGTEANGIKPSVKDVIALMQKLVGLRDDSFQLIPQ